jgi:dolichyl-phosphate-mannose-protein mannosyltransferase
MFRRPEPIADPLRRQRIAIVVALILLVSAGVRLYQLATPAQYMFDEVYYAKDAKAIVDGRVKPRPPLRWEAGDEVSWPHPEMGKFAIALGIIVFGNRAFGWRIPAVIAGLVTLACVYPLARRLGLSASWAVIALLFAAADTLGITQSRIATLDIFVAVWTVLCILMALRYVQEGRHKRWLFLCGLTGGLATATKWSGALALLASAVILVVAWWNDRERPAAEAALGEANDAAPLLGESLTDAAHHAEIAVDEPTAARNTLAPVLATLLAIVALVLVPAIVFMASYTQYFVAGHTFADWKELMRQALYFNLHLKATHTYASPAISWIVDIRPVWYYFQGGETYRGVIAMGNPFLWWLATLCLLAAPLLALLRRTTLLLPAAVMVALLYLPWLATSRTSFLYYMTPVAPFMAILAAAGLVAFAGRVPLPRRGALMLAAFGLATALLWDPTGRLFAWVFWELPRRVGPAFGWTGVGIGVFIALMVIVALISERLRPARPLIAMAVAGLVIGIAVAFMPIVLNIPISPGHFSHITWFQSWI